MSTSCRSCGATSGEVVLDLGHQPSAESFPDAGSRPVDDPRHPLRLWFCSSCRLAQLREDPGTAEEQVVAVDSEAMLAQVEATLGFADDLGLLTRGSHVVEHGSPHGGSLVGPLEARGLVAVDPDEGPADLVVDVYGLLHEPDQDAALRGRVAEVRPDGALVLQLHSLAAAVTARQPGELRHGHFGYWSLPALDDALRRLGWGVHRARSFPLDGGTLVVVATATPEPDAEVARLLAAEEAAGVTSSSGLRVLQRAADDAATALRAWLEEQRSRGRTVVGYGAATRAVPLLCHAGIDSSLLPMVADAAATKHGRRLPGTDVPVVAPEVALAERPDRVLLFVPDLLEEVRRALPDVEASGARWVVLDPTPRVLNPSGAPRER